VKRKGAPVKRKGPQTLREWLAQGRGPYGSPIGRGDMTAAHARHLIETYPGLFRHADSPTVSSSPAFARYGFGCGDGWFDIIDRLAMKLVEDPYLVAVQVKEKLAELRFYLDRVDGAPPPDPVLAKRLEAERADACERSRRTCELCGAPGKTEETKRHWFFVRCKSCSWLDDLVQACEYLGKLVEGKDFDTFAASEMDIVVAKFHLVRHVAVAAEFQPARVRKRFPAIDWRRLDKFRAVPNRVLKIDEDPEMSAEEIWKFIHEDVPVIKDVLR
jgi:uncharacterized protein with HEPN domain